MLNESNLSPDQQKAITRLIEYDATLLVAATGVGKTAICLTAIEELMEMNYLRKVIVAAPARVIENLVWPNEAAKWKHLRGLRVLQLQGTAQNRIKQLLSCEAEIIVVSLNNLDWLLMQDHECDGIIIDELSKAAGKQAKKLKSKKFGGQLKWRVGMTATPVSQDFFKLYPMCRILDHGQALGTNKQKYMEKYFYSDYMGHNWSLRDGADEQIMAQVAPLVHLVADNKAETLPALHEHVIRFDMPARPVKSITR
jgi:superfamily II DNA or RNA helicase